MSKVRYIQTADTISNFTDTIYQKSDISRIRYDIQHILMENDTNTIQCIEKNKRYFDATTHSISHDNRNPLTPLVLPPTPLVLPLASHRVRGG